MKRGCRLSIAAALSPLILILSLSARAELALEGVHWQVGRVEGGRASPTQWQDISVLETTAGRFEGRLRARLVLKNRGPKAAEGILIHYSLDASLAAEKTGGQEGPWAVPFSIDEKRVPHISPNKIIELPIDIDASVESYIKRLLRTGWRPTRLRIDAMLEPHQGTTVLQTVSDTLVVEDQGRAP